MRVGGKRTKPLSIEVLCDWAERVQPTTTQLQRRRVLIIPFFNRAYSLLFLKGLKYCADQPVLKYRQLPEKCLRRFSK